MDRLAIATVPIQPWEEPLEAAEALNAGTAFRALQLPFYIEEQMQKPEAMPENDCERLLAQIRQVSFLLTDLKLYMDTHPDEDEAAGLYQSTRLKRKELLAQFASDYYPLTQDCEGCQMDGPAPWEGGC